MLQQSPRITNILQIPPNHTDNSITIHQPQMTNLTNSDNLGIPALKSSGTKKKLSVWYYCVCTYIYYCNLRNNI